jgi:lipid II:glycine glycyltransferase (peptidoglycan interpeptide bridge formation enzyme)
MYEAGNADRLLQSFYALLVLTCRRKRLPPQPLEWFRNLVASFGENATIRVASKDNQPIASILTLAFKNSLLYKYACSDARFHALGGVQALLWHAIEDGKRSGLAQLDLGRSDSDQHGLLIFKSRWGAASTSTTYLRCADTDRGRRVETTSLRFARRVFARLPDRLLVTAGELLYRHAG